MRQPRSQYRFETSLMRKFSDWMPDGKITSLGQGFFLHAGAQRGMGHSTPQGIGIRRFLSMRHLDSPPLMLHGAFAEVERGSAARKLCFSFCFFLFISFLSFRFAFLSWLHFISLLAAWAVSNIKSDVEKMPNLAWVSPSATPPVFLSS